MSIKDCFNKVKGKVIEVVDDDALKGIKKLGKNLTAPKAKTHGMTCYTGYDLSAYGISRVEGNVLILQDKGLNIGNYYEPYSNSSSIDEYGRL